MNKALYFLLLLSITSFAQSGGQDGSKFQDEYQLKITRTTSEIKIDGELNEAIWQTADAAKDFWQKWPNDVGKEKRKTIIRATYDERYVYFAAVCYDTNSYVVQTLKRDTRYWDSDGLAIVLDPVNRRSNGFFFGISPYNVQVEDLISASSFGDDVNFSWDNKWFSATKRYEDRWTVEVAIPFKTLRFEAENTKWGVNFIRNDLKNNLYNTWTHVPVQFPGFDFGYTGALIWDKAPAKQGTNVSLIPYVTGSAIGNREEKLDTKYKANAGLDAKLAVTSSLNLDVTVNPDFSQIEVDRQVTNLTRFNIFLPERRTFFLENDDIFSQYGAPPFRPFYSRSIGLDRNGNTIPIIGGLRLSGNANKNLRIGVMNMQTASSGKQGEEDYTAAQNYTAATFNQRVGSRSSVKGYFLNRQGFMNDAEIQKNPLDQFGRNGGMELNYSNPTGSLNLWGGYHLSMKPNIKDKNAFYQLGAGYFGKNFSTFIDFADFGQNYYTDMGYVNRIENFTVKGASYDDGEEIVRMGFAQLYNENEYNIRPKTGKINNIRFGIENYLVWLPNGKLNEMSNTIRFGMNFKNTSGFRFQFIPQFTDLLFYTPLPETKPLEPGRYRYNQYIFRYSSDSRKKLALEANVTAGGFYNGTAQQYRLGLTYRQQPWGNFTLNFEQNNLKFPVGYGDVSLFLISPRIEINFSNNVFWTTFIQYNTQQNNFNINSRLQYRYKPMSDFFLVYTDNYFTDPFLKNKNRALVFKLNYWLTL
jgi:hypothetical protein